MDNLNFLSVMNNFQNPVPVYNCTVPLPLNRAAGGVTDGLTLSPEALEDDGRDRAIDEYFQKLAQDRGNTPDAQNFAELMGYITKELKDIDNTDWHSAHDKFADTMRNVQDKVDAKGITSKGTTAPSPVPASDPKSDTKSDAKPDTSDKK